MTVATDISIDKSRLVDICLRYQITELALFGSTATGTRRAETDIDLLVTYNPSARISLFTNAAAQRELTQLFQHSVDLVSKRALRPELQTSILPSARTLYAGG